MFWVVWCFNLAFACLFWNLLIWCFLFCRFGWFALILVFRVKIVVFEAIYKTEVCVNLLHFGSYLLVDLWFKILWCLGLVLFGLFWGFTNLVIFVLWILCLRWFWCLWIKIAVFGLF